MTKLVVTGVAGSGKSALGARLAAALACPLVEGDDFHPEDSHQKVLDGIALDDADHEPWLARLAQLLVWRRGGMVLACPALKRRHRDQLRSSVPEVRFVHLDIDLATAAQRVGARSGHLFPKSLVTSQFAVLESPSGETGVLEISALVPPEVQVNAVLQWLAAGAEPYRTRSAA